MSDVFPTYEASYNRDDTFPNYCPDGGLTKRELFAAMAMQGIMYRLVEYKENMIGRKDGQFVVDQLAIDSVRAADALIAELENEGEKHGK